ncbi:MAG: hypothetical protein IKN60_04420 [Bacteroidales bacterium]|nr:hypothetical protein [Bacteroidales bacterium]
MAIKHAPNVKVTNLGTPTRSGNKITQKWKNPKGATSGDRAFGSIGLHITLDGVNTKDKKGKTVKHDKSYDRTTTASSTSYDFKLTRKAWYPYKGKPKLHAINFKVRGRNSKGNGPWHKGPALTFTAPAAPACEVTVDLEHGEVTCKATAEDKGGAAERHDTRLVVTKSSNFLSPASSQLADKTGAGETVSSTHDIPQSKTLTRNQWIKVTMEAWTRGLAGDSAHVKREHVFAWPATATIESVRPTDPTSRSGMVLVGIKTNHDASKHPVTAVQLQRLRSSSATTPQDATVASGWSDVSGATDDAQCTGLSDQLADAYPTDGTRTWYRIKSTHDDYTVYSEPKQLPVYNPAPGSEPADDAVTITKASPLADGTTLAVEMFWEVEGAADDGTELSWSTDEHAWRSASGPETFTFEWDDGQAVLSDGESHDHTATVYVPDLEEGTSYYIRARRYSDGDDGRTFAAYSDTVVGLPTSSPGEVTLEAPAYVARGDDLEVRWSHNSERPQAAWGLASSVGTWAGTGMTEALTIPASELEEADEVDLRAAVCTTIGGIWSTSAISKTQIVERPSCAVDVPATLTATPLAVTVATDAMAPSVSLVVRSAGTSVVLPDGIVRQAEGEVVWSSDDAQTGAWEEVGDELVAIVTLPDGDATRPELWDGCAYVVTAMVTDGVTGIRSEPATAETIVTWAHQADEPSATIRTSDGSHLARVELEAPATAALGDVCDLYRVSLGVATLIAEGLPFGSVVTDRLAPFASEWREHELRYRVACRTHDGDVAWADVPYELTCESVWLDWGDSDSVELPYDLVYDDTHAKDFEARAHPLDEVPEEYGVIAEGYWGPDVRHTLAISTDLAKTRDYGHIEALEACANHAGPVFVRLPNGRAFEGNAVPSRMSESYTGTPVAITVDVEEIALTDEHRPSVDRGEVVLPAWSGGALVAAWGSVYDEAGYPLPEWQWVGMAEGGTTGYAVDPDDAVHDLTGSALDGWAWDGATLTDQNGDPVPLAGEEA